MFYGIYINEDNRALRLAVLHSNTRPKQSHSRQSGYIVPERSLESYRIRVLPKGSAKTRNEALPSKTRNGAVNVTLLVAVAVALPVRRFHVALDLELRRRRNNVS